MTRGVTLRFHSALHSSLFGVSDILKTDGETRLGRDGRRMANMVPALRGAKKATGIAAMWSAPSPGNPGTTLQLDKYPSGRRKVASWVHGSVLIRCDSKHTFIGSLPSSPWNSNTYTRQLVAHRRSVNSASLTSGLMSPTESSRCPNSLVLKEP
jgi:hypothetical protein